MNERLFDVTLIVTEILEVKNKRRIYDITNVLEGVGLIEKVNKNFVRWWLVVCRLPTLTTQRPGAHWRRC